MILQFVIIATLSLNQLYLVVLIQRRRVEDSTILLLPEARLMLYNLNSEALQDDIYYACTSTDLPTIDRLQPAQLASVETIKCSPSRYYNN